jgi:hypothetical protein
MASLALSETLELKLHIIKEHVAAATAMQRSPPLGNGPREG